MKIKINNFVVFFHNNIRKIVKYVELGSDFLSKKIEVNSFIFLGWVLKIFYLICIQIVILYFCNTLLLLINLIFFIFQLDLYYILKYLINLIKNIIRIYIIYLCSWILILYFLLSYIEWVNSDLYKVDKSDINIYFFLVSTYNYIAEYISSEVNTIFFNINTLNKSLYVNNSISFDILDEYSNSDFINITNVNYIDSFLETECLNECHHWNDYLLFNINKSEIIISRVNDVIVSEYNKYNYFILILDILKIDIDYKGKIFSVYSAYYIAEKNIFMYYKNGTYYYNSIVRNTLFYMCINKDINFENDVLVNLNLHKTYVDINKWKQQFLSTVQFKDLILENEKNI